MNNVRILITLCFVAAFGAGLVAGKLWERTAKADAPPDVIEVVQPPVPTQTSTNVVLPPPPPAPEPGWLKELNLSPEQNKQMGQIWSETMKKRPFFSREKRDALVKERDESIKAALTEEQRAKQKELNSTFDAKRREIWNNLRAAEEKERHQKDDAFKALLSDDQKKQIELANKNYEAKVEEASKDKEWKKTFDDAVVKTRAILSPEQCKKYDEQRNKFQGPPNRFGPRHDGARPDGPRPDGQRQGPRPGGGGADGPRGDAHDGGGKPLVKPKSGFVLEKVGGSRARVSCPPQVTFQA